MISAPWGASQKRTAWIRVTPVYPAGAQQANEKFKGFFTKAISHMLHGAGVFTYKAGQEKYQWEFQDPKM